MKTSLAQSTEGTARDTSSRRFVLLFCLCLAEYLPISLLSTTIPVLMRKAGASLEDIGAVAFTFFPWALKFLWAPMVDRWGSERLGRYRSWLLVLVPIVAALVVGLAFLDLPYMLIHARSAGIGLLIGLTVLCATIDTAAHGLGVVTLAPEERGFGNGVQTAGQMAGQLLGGGIAVMCIGWAGWRAACLGLAALYMFPFVAIALAHEPRLLKSARPQALRDFFEVLRRAHSGRWFAWLLARCLKGVDSADIPAALRRYEAARSGRTASVHAKSIRNGRLFTLPDGLRQWARDLALRRLSLQSFSWLYGYDVLHAPI